MWRNDLRLGPGLDHNAATGLALPVGLAKMPQNCPADGQGDFAPGGAEGDFQEPGWFERAGRGDRRAARGRLGRLVALTLLLGLAALALGF